MVEGGQASVLLSPARLLPRHISALDRWHARVLFSDA